MSEAHAAHRVWQLAAQRAASAALNGYPTTRALPGIHLNNATHHARLKANGTLNGEAFRFETTNNGTALLKFPDADGTLLRQHGPILIVDAGLTGNESSDIQLSTLITVLRDMPGHTDSIS